MHFVCEGEGGNSATHIRIFTHVQKQNIQLNLNSTTRGAHKHTGETNSHTLKHNENYDYRIGEGQERGGGLEYVCVFVWLMLVC